jgi:ankyrin repeat protein
MVPALARHALLVTLFALAAPPAAAQLEERACRINFDDCARDIQAVCSKQVNECNRGQDQVVRNCQAQAQANHEGCVRWAQQNRQDPGRTCDGHRRSFEQCRNDSQRRQLTCSPSALGCATRERCDVNFQLCMRDVAAARQSKQPPQREAQPEAPRARDPAPPPTATPESAPRERASPLAMQLGGDLRAAAARGNAVEVERLIREGAALNAPDNTGATALHLAAGSGNVVITELLIRSGASIRAQTTQGGLTALHFAARRHDGAPVAELLLQAGASVRGQDGWTPLHVATGHANVAVAEVLIQNNAPVNAQTGRGVTPLRVAACADRSEDAVIETVTLLLAVRADPNLFGEIAPPIHCSAIRSLRMTRLLLDKGANPKAGPNGNTVLHEGLVFRGWPENKEMVELLLDRGVDPNAANDRGETPLHRAVNIGAPDPEPIAVALRRGAQPNRTDKEGRTALHLHLRGCPSLASDRDCERMTVRYPVRKGLVELLLKHGADLNARDNTGQTPLHVLLRAVDKRPVWDGANGAALLVAKGANPNLKDAAGKSPLDVAREIQPPDRAQAYVRALGG